MDWKNTEIPFDSLTELAYIIADYVIESAIHILTEGELRPIKSAAQVITEAEQLGRITSSVHVTEEEILRLIQSAEEVVTEQPEEAVAGEKHEVGNIQWMMCKNFSTVKGLLQIEQYLQTWELHESWLHWTNYIDDEKLQYSSRYHYRVRWSIPTCRKPIPRATANVYFIIEVSRIKPDTLPVEVFFVIETNRFIHRPGECRFKEKWLKDVIESKVTLMETVNF